MRNTQAWDSEELMLCQLFCVDGDVLLSCSLCVLENCLLRSNSIMLAEIALGSISLSFFREGPWILPSSLWTTKVFISFVFRLQFLLFVQVLSSPECGNDRAWNELYKRLDTNSWGRRRHKPLDF